MGDVASVGLLDKKYSRRSFIKGVIAAGATASSTGYLMGGPTALGAQSMPGATERLITLNINGQDVDALYQRMRAEGHEILTPLRDEAWRRSTLQRSESISLLWRVSC